jgi:hypothetical protein
MGSDRSRDQGVVFHLPLLSPRHLHLVSFFRTTSPPSPATRLSGPACRSRSRRRHHRISTPPTRRRSSAPPSMAGEVAGTRWNPNFDATPLPALNRHLARRRCPRYRLAPPLASATVIGDLLASSPHRTDGVRVTDSGIEGESVVPTGRSLVLAHDRSLIRVSDFNGINCTLETFINTFCTHLKASVESSMEQNMLELVRPCYQSCSNIRYLGNFVDEFASYLMICGLFLTLLLIRCDKEKEGNITYRHPGFKRNADDRAAGGAAATPLTV